MPTITRDTPISQQRTARETGAATGSAQHRVDVGAVVEASTTGSGSVRGDITTQANTQGINCVDPADMLQRLSAPTITGGASASRAYTIAAEVRVDLAVDMQAQAEAMARVVGDVVNNTGSTDIPCFGEEQPAGGGEPVASTAPPREQKPTQKGS